MPSKVFISYRRDDAKWQAREIYRALTQVLPRDCVFMDIDSVPIGIDFADFLEGWVDQCDIMLVLIAAGWADGVDPKTGRPRLENPDDFVRIEVRKGLARGIPVVPILLDGAQLPEAGRLPDDLLRLVRRQAEFIHHRTVDTDVDRLIQKLRLTEQSAQPLAEKPAVVVQDRMPAEDRITKVDAKLTKNDKTKTNRTAKGSDGISLRAHMIRVYNYMAGGVALTGFVAWFTYQASVVTNAAGAIVGITPFGRSLFGAPVMWVLMLVGLVSFISIRIGHMQASTAKMLFFVYAGLMGVSLATIFMVYTQTSITRVFFISAAAFGALSLYGYTTQRSLDGMGSFLIMGMFGLIIAILVNIFLKSSGLDWTLSVAGVLIFTGLVAWRTQKIAEMHDDLDDRTMASHKAVMGAIAIFTLLRYAKDDP
jgi:uncharacterized protein